MFGDRTAGVTESDVRPLAARKVRGMRAHQRRRSTARRRDNRISPRIKELNGYRPPPLLPGETGAPPHTGNTKLLSYSAYGKPVQLADSFFRENRRHQRVTEFRLRDHDYQLSTVLLPFDHSFGHGPPLMWETMIFGGMSSIDVHMWRYGSRAAAYSAHDHITVLIQRLGAELQSTWEGENVAWIGASKKMRPQQPGSALAELAEYDPPAIISGQEPLTAERLPDGTTALLVDHQGHALTTREWVELLRESGPSTKTRFIRSGETILVQSGFIGVNLELPDNPTLMAPYSTVVHVGHLVVWQWATATPEAMTSAHRGASELIRAEQRRRGNALVSRPSRAKRYR